MIPGTDPSALPPPPGHYMGQLHGRQSVARWAPGQNDPRGIVDVKRALALWRISVFGPVIVELVYGTDATRSIVELAAPIVVTVPGQANIYVRPLDEAHAEEVLAVATCTPATAGALSQLRRLVAGPNLALNAGAFRYFALTASVLDVRGVVVNVPACSWVPLITGSSLTSGDGYEEFEP